MPKEIPPPLPPPKPAKIAVVLGAGASKGFAHVGVLKVLESQKIPIHLIVGTSAGSVRREPLRLRHRCLPAPDDGHGPSERRRGRSDPARQRFHPRGQAREFHQQNGPPDPPRTAEDPLPRGRHESPDRRGDRLRDGEHRQGGPGELLHSRGLPAGPDRGQGLRGRRRGAAPSRWMRPGRPAPMS